MWNIEVSNNVESTLLEETKSAYDALLKRQDLGFFQLSLIDEAITQVENVKSFFKSKSNLVVIGLGGSSLGTKAIFEALYPNHWKSKVHFLDNVDGFSLDQFLNSIDNPAEMAWILCSKSGGTIEVTTLYDYCYQWIKDKFGMEITANTFLVTEDKDSLLTLMAKEQQIPYLSMPKSIGGRFSVFTPVGLLPLSFLGVNLRELKKGFEQCLQDNSLVITLSSQMMASILRGDSSFYFFQYSDQLGEWSLWLQQLLSESLSKRVTRDNIKAPIFPTVVPCRGASDQHSVLQQIIEGLEKKFCCFHRVQTSESSAFNIKESLFPQSLMVGKSPGELLSVEAKATEAAMQKSQISTMVLKVNKVNEQSISYLMAAWMLSTGVLGELMNINAFDQPGVESGKSIARRVLSQVN